MFLQKLILLAVLLLIQTKAFGYDSNAMKICNKYSYRSNVEACYLRIKGKEFSELGVSICDKHSYVSNKESCILSIADSYLDPAGVAICDKHSYVSNKQQCMVKIKDLSFTQEIIDMCDRHSYVSNKVSCLAKFGESFDEDLELKEQLVIKLQRALRNIDSGNLKKAKKNIRRAIRKIENQL